jgi:hypothetical protein
MHYIGTFHEKSLRHYQKKAVDVIFFKISANEASLAEISKIYGENSDLPFLVPRIISTGVKAADLRRF